MVGFPKFGHIPYGTKFLREKILMNGHLENIYKKNFDEFHNVNAHTHY